MNYAKYSDRVARLYRAIEDELLVSLARRFATTAERTTGTFNYEAALLARMGAVRKDTSRIIAGMVREGEPMIEEAVKTAMLDAVKAEEPHLLGAVQAGMLEGAELTVDESVNLRLAHYINQAKDKLNLVNTTMLESTARAYRVGVAAFQAAQDALDREAAALIIGAKDGRSAIQSAVRAMLDSGIDGFVDRRGRHWSAEGYAAMVINTTSGSAATQAALDFNSAYGNHYIAVRTNATARPGCAPWQGKIIDMSGSGGRVPDENGVMLEAYPVGVTTYGQPAGIFGINCHHVPPIPFIPGYSGMRYEPNDTEGNAERYKLTQTQRRLEREVRNAKREQAMLEAAGDEEGAKLAAQKVRQKQQRVKDLVDSNPDVLVRRYENEWVKTYNDKRGGVWYNGGVGGKSSSVSRKYTAYQHHKDGTIVVTDDRKNEKHPSIPKTYRPYAVIETRSVKGTETQIDRTFYDENGNMVRQIHGGSHARLDKHPYGSNGEHAHDYLWQDGKPIKTTRELTEEERKESSDIVEY